MNALEHNTGIEILDLRTCDDFQSRSPRNRSMQVQIECLRRLTHISADEPDRALQELVDAACSLCDADSSGVSLETTDPDGCPVFHWVATSGRYARFLDAMLPNVWMPCAVCLDRANPQLVRVPKRHFDAMGIEADSITDGMLFPWEVEGQRGTIWVLAHGRNQAFDRLDYELMQGFADFAAIAVRHRRQQQRLFDQATASATAAIANELAHRINNPLQSITNLLYLVLNGGDNIPDYARQATSDLERVSALVRELLTISQPVPPHKS